MLSSEEIRKRYIDYWKSDPRNHIEIPNTSLIPNNDPSLLFVNSGMFPLVPYLLGQPHPLGTRLFNMQRCIRTKDIDEVGDNRHCTLFEMVGNWSLGDFTKEEQIPWMFELYVKVFGLDVRRLYVSIWEGDDTVPQDDVAIKNWQKMFKKHGINARFSDNVTNIPKDVNEGNNWEYRIFPYGKESNWWSRGAKVEGEPGGPTTEIFYDLGTKERSQDKYHINDDSGRFIEIGNSVFMEYKLDKDLKWQPLKQKNIDYGGGFERIMIAVQNVNDVYETDLFIPYIKKCEELSGEKYESSIEITENVRNFRVVAEHSRAATFILADGVTPSNKDQGYILRRLIRRLVRHGIKLGIKNNFAKVMAQEVIDKMEKVYPHLKQNQDTILSEIDKEETNFKKTLQKGLKEIEQLLNSNQKIDGTKMFNLYETYGFPPEMTLEELDIGANEVEKLMNEFEVAVTQHKEKSRQGADQKFKGGLADTTEEITKLHTLHHLLLASLKKIVDPNIVQKGSNITAERLRLDFNFERKLTDDEVKQVETMVNDVIEKDLFVTRHEMPKDEAERLGAEMEFGQKYPDIVSVYIVSKSKAITDDRFSAEFCEVPM